MSLLIKKIVFPLAECPHPVGAIIELMIGDNPATIWTGTTWIQFGGGRVTVAIDGAIPAFSALENTGGSVSHVMTLGNLIEHDHNRNVDGLEESVNVDSAGTIAGSYSPGANYLKLYTKTAKTGQASPDPIPTLPPYIVVARWERTA